MDGEGRYLSNMAPKAVAQCKNAFATSVALAGSCGQGHIRLNLQSPTFHRCNTI